jgi:hypothetical protein
MTGKPSNILILLRRPRRVAAPLSGFGSLEDMAAPHHGIDGLRPKSHRIARLIEHAVRIEPITYRTVVAQSGQP